MVQVLSTSSILAAALIAAAPLALTAPGARLRHRAPLQSSGDIRTPPSADIRAFREPSYL